MSEVAEHFIRIRYWERCRALWLAIFLAGCSSNPADDPNIYNCGDGYYAKTKAQCPGVADRLVCGQGRIYTRGRCRP